MPAGRARPLDHTGDVGFELSAPDLASLFGAAREALLAELMTAPPGDAGAEDAREAAVELQAPAVDRLLLRWLDELLFRVQAGRRVPVRCEVQVAPPVVGGSAWKLRAWLVTVPLDREAHGWRGEVKGTTYHGLEVTRRRSGWHARVILDV